MLSETDGTSFLLKTVASYDIILATFDTFDYSLIPKSNKLELY